MTVQAKDLRPGDVFIAPRSSNQYIVRSNNVHQKKAHKDAKCFTSYQALSVSDGFKVHTRYLHPFGTCFLVRRGHPDVFLVNSRLNYTTDLRYQYNSSSPTETRFKTTVARLTNIQLR